MPKLYVSLLVLAGLTAVSGTAAAQQRPDVQGPALVGARGQLEGEVRAAKAMRVEAGGGYVGVMDLGGDLDVTCTGGELRDRRSVDGHRQVLCVGRHIQVQVSGKRFVFKAQGRRLGALVPVGATASLLGDFRLLDRGPAGQAGGGRPNAPARGSAPPGDVDPDVNHDGKVDADDVIALLGK